MQDEIETHKTLNIFRYQFTITFMNELHNFSKIHQFDSRIDFKQNWKTWTEDNEILINQEIQRLNQLGFSGNVLEKMFKSARYYFRKKSNEKKIPKTRQLYIGVDKLLLIAMDDHIINNVNTNDFQPKKGFNDFCIENEILLKQMITYFFTMNIKQSSIIQTKLKKTYNNRYYIFKNK